MDRSWPIEKLGRTARIGNGSTPRRDSTIYWDSGDVPWLNSSVVNESRVTQAEQFVTAAALRECHLPVVAPGSVLVGLTGQGKTRGMATILDIEATLNQHVAYVTPDRSRWFPEYLLWSLRAAYDELRCLSEENGSTKGGLTCEALKQFRLTVPPIGYQRAIAGYLDRETARIDTLIEEQQRLIEMLRERRQAVVDTAFAALGEPSVQLRRYIKFLTSGSRGWGDYYADDGERFLRIGNLPRTNLSIRGEVQFVSLPAGVTEGSRTILKAGDLLFSITAYLGSVAVVDSDWIGSYVSQHVALCRLDSDRLDSRFAGWFMLTTAGQDQLNQGAAGGAKMQLALDDIKGLRVPTASIAEQHRIAAHLDEQTAKIDTLIAETQRLIELARERRAALITAAVTGQVDVREAA
ncbi:restriction endonuclease subunit S [Streptosporangium canum]|uniref:restriction endonuclease subunit S n=1 Tax=Streptosporangium canum TaxID=324952 RepID=UPI0036890D88